MKLKLLLIAGCMGLFCSACTQEQEAITIPETVPEVTEQETYPVLDDPNAEFIDAPETAPIIIDPDPVPETEPLTEIYNDAPEIMPENQE